MPPHTTSSLDDPSRLQALYRTALLDSSAEEAFDRLARLAVKVLRVPVALVSLVDHNRQFFKSCLGLPEPWLSERQTPLSHSFCQHTIESREPLVIEDARTHPLVRDNLAIADLHVIAYAGIPLITSDGYVLGSFCAIDTKPRVWTDDDIDLLQEFATSVMSEIELRLATFDLQAAVREREALLSIASHELKSPITSINGYAQLLQRRLTPGYTVTERDVRSVETIRNQGERVSKMLDTLLDSAHLETGQFPFSFAPVDLNLLARRVVADLALSAPDHTLVCATDTTPVVVRGDELRLEQVLINLVSNAIKYSPTGTTVRVDTCHAIEQVQLIVQDHGIGIPADAIPTLFQRFTRVQSEHTQQINGLGLGLYIVKEIVTHHNGTITVSSVEGQGSTFTVTLPLISSR